MVGPRSQILRIHNYMLWSLRDQYGMNNIGLYIVDQSNDSSKFCNRQLSTNYGHKYQMIANKLDYDIIDTENTDYTYIHEEEEFTNDSNHINSDNVMNTSQASNFEFNGKIISLSNTEVLTASHTNNE